MPRHGPAIDHPPVGVQHVVERRGERMLWCEPEVGDEGGALARQRQGAGERPVAERGAEYVPAAVQVQQRGQPRGLGLEEQRGHAARVDRADADFGRRRELGVHRLEGRSQVLETGAGLAELDHGLPEPVPAPHELTADGLCPRDRHVHLGEDRAGVVEQRIARQCQLDPVRRPPEQLAADEPLERTDLAAQGGLGEVQPVRGAAEVQVLGDGHEGTQVAQLDGVGRLGETAGRWRARLPRRGLSPALADRDACRA